MTQSSCPTHKVLFVDDEPHVVSALRRALRREPYEFLSASSGLSGLEVLEKTPMDLVVADQDMPGMKGTEFLSHVAKLYPDTVRFMLTGKPTLDVAVQAINAGAISRFFTKPANDVDLAVCIAQALKHKDLMAEASRLLRRLREQNAILEYLEEQNPGITRLDRDTFGSILVEEYAPGDYEKLIEEMRAIPGD